MGTRKPIVTDWGSVADNLKKDLVFDPRVLFSVVEVIEEERGVGQETWRKIARMAENDDAITFHIYRRAFEVLKREGRQDRQLRDLSDALLIIGEENLKRILYEASTQDLVDRLYKSDTPKWNFYKVHAIATGIAAEKIGELWAIEDDALYSMGVMANIGRVFFHIWRGDEYFDRVERQLEYKMESERCQMEEIILEMNHCGLGHDLLERWRMPPRFRLAAKHHEDIECLSDGDIDPPVKAVTLANFVGKVAMPTVPFNTGRDQEAKSIREFNEEREDFVENLITMFAATRMRVGGRVLDEEQLRATVSNLRLDVYRGTNDKLVQLKIPVPGTGEVDNTLVRQRLRSTADRWARELSQTVAHSITESMRTTPTEYSYLAQEVASASNMDEKSVAFERLTYWILLYLYNSLQGMMFRAGALGKSDSREHVFRLVDNELSTIALQGRIDGLVRKNHDWLTANLGGSPLTSAFLRNYERHSERLIGWRRLWTSKNLGKMSDEDYSALINSLVVDSIALLSLKTSLVFWVNSTSLSEESDIKRYQIETWHHSHIPESESKTYRTNKNLNDADVYIMDSTKGILNLYPWVIREPCIQCGAVHPFLLVGSDVDEGNEHLHFAMKSIDSPAGVCQMAVAFQGEKKAKFARMLVEE